MSPLFFVAAIILVAAIAWKLCSTAMSPRHEVTKSIGPQEYGYRIDMITHVDGNTTYELLRYAPSVDHWFPMGTWPNLEAAQAAITKIKGMAIATREEIYKE
jgi:hypothetical protein